MKSIMVYMILTLALLASCSPAPLPRPTPDITVTSQTANATIIADTQLPTNTPAPFALSTNTRTAAKTRIRATKTVYVPFFGCFTPTGVTNFTAPFKIENLTKSKVSVFINGITKTGEHPVSCSYNLRSHTSVIFTIWWGNYTYLVQITGRTTYQGSFWVNDHDKATLRVTNDGIKIGPFP